MKVSVPKCFEFNGFCRLDIFMTGLQCTLDTLTCDVFVLFGNKNRLHYILLFFNLSIYSKRNCA